MTAAVLIKEVLMHIRDNFYVGQPKAFAQFQRPLIKAITTYAYECNKRGWNVQPDFIRQELLSLLEGIKGRAVEHLPSYFESAVRRHVGARAEEIQQESRRTACNRVMRGIKPVVVVERTHVEELAALHQDLDRELRAKNKPAQGKQLKLI